MRFKKLKVGIDVDDVLYGCASYAVDLINEKGLLDPPLSIQEITNWGENGERGNLIFPYFSDPDFYKSQPILEGAQAFIHKLTKMADVFFVTAVHPQAMTIRAMRLRKDFPEVPAENLIIGNRKDLIPLDIILDDGAHNIFRSNSTFPVLMRRPWNQHVSGCLSVNTYDEFLTIVDMIRTENVTPSRKANIFVLVGPSGSGKTAIMNKVCEYGFAHKAKSYTARPKRTPDEDDYYFVTEEEFFRMEANGELLESSRYAGNPYGTTVQEITECAEKGNVIMALDICGALAVKRVFGNKSVLIYVDRHEYDLLIALLKRDSDDDEKAKRIMSLQDEKKNEDFCDITFYNDVAIDSDEMKKRLKELFRA